MNLLLLHPSDILPTRPPARSVSSGRAEVRGERLRHLRKVLKADVGDAIRVGLLHGPVGIATVESIDHGRAVLEFSCSESPPEPMPVDLLLALPRPKFLGRILQNAASMGVRSIHLFHSARVEKSYWSSRLFDEGAMERHLVLGLEQGRDTRLPELTLLRAFDEAVSWVESWNERPEEPGAAANVWLADGAGDNSFPRALDGEAALVIGPEGGLLEVEIERLVAAGARSASLGPRPLRVETAVSVALGRFLPDVP